MEEFDDEQNERMDTAQSSSRMLKNKGNCEKICKQ